MQIEKHSKTPQTSERERRKRNHSAALVFCVVVLLASGCATTIVEFRCPFGPATVDVENEELDGKLDDAPATLNRLMEIDHECGFDREEVPETSLLPRWFRS